MHTKLIVRAALTAALVTTASLSTPALASTVGNSAVNRGFADSSPGLTFILDQGFGAAAGQLSSFNFFAGRAGDVTPLLFNRVDANGTITFTLLGIGTTRNVGTGAYTFDFGLTQGTDLASTNAYFGFRTANVGVVSYGYQSSTLPGAFAVQNTSSGVGTSFTFGPNGASDNGYGLNYRGYSINATTAPVPEPATWAMMMLGLGGMGYAMRRKSKVRARIRFA